MSRLRVGLSAILSVRNRSLLKSGEPTMQDLACGWLDGDERAVMRVFVGKQATVP